MVSEEISKRKVQGGGTHMKVFIEYQDAWGKWIQYTTLNHVPTASLQANRRANSTNKKHRLTDASGAVLDMFIP